MRLPGTPSLAFLAYLLIFLPWLAYRSAGRIRVAKGASANQPFPRATVWTSTLVSQIVLLTLAWLTGRGFGYSIFEWSSLRWRDGFAALTALAICFALRGLSRKMRSDEERRRMMVYRLAPRSPREWSLWATTVLVASVAEETAYRGVG